MTEQTRSPADAWVGRVVAEKYRVARCLGVGGHGAVFEAENTWTGRRVALKVLLGAAALNAEMSERFLREARAATRVGHPNIVEVLDMGRDPLDGSLFIVQELLVGEDLREVLRRERAVDPRWLVATLAPVMDALSAAHALGVIHRDLKPANIFLARQHDGRVAPKLIDFGVSRMVDGGPEANEITHAGALLGTPDYMSPEQARGDRSGAQADVWAMGVVLYESVSGQRPYRAANYNALLLRILADDAPPLRDVAPGVDPALEAIVTRALARDLARRFGSMAELRDALLAWASAAPWAPPAAPLDAPPAPPDGGHDTPLSIDPPAMLDADPPPSAHPAYGAHPDDTEESVRVVATTPPPVRPQALPAPSGPAAPRAPSPSLKATLEAPPPVAPPLATPHAWASAAPARPSTGRARLVSIAAATALVTGFGAWGAYRLTRPSPAPPSRPVAAPAPPSVAPSVDASAPVAQVVPEVTAPDHAAPAAADASEAQDDTAARADAGRERRPGPSRRPPAAPPPPPAQETPSAVEIRAVLQGLTPAVRGCVGERDATVLVAVVIRGAGRVERVQIPAPWDGTAAGACIGAVVGRARFTPFRQDRFTISWPYVIRASAAPATAGSR